MIKDLTVTTVQTSLQWQDPAANRKHIEQHLESVEETDIIILPEMFTTGFTMNVSEFSESKSGPTMTWMHKMASKKNAIVSGSLIIKEDHLYYNRLIWMKPSGDYEYYNKRHLFSFAKEDQYYQSGQSRLIVTVNGWKICPLICYDLRFPVWSRNDCDYDLLSYVANWPVTRISDWDLLLQARALENLTYVVGVNIVGQDKNGLKYNGHSTVIAPGDKGILYKKEDVVAVSTVSLSHSYLQEYRKSFGFLRDRDNYIIS